MRMWVMVIAVALISACVTLVALRYFAREDSDRAMVSAAHSSQPHSRQPPAQSRAIDRQTGDEHITALARLEPENGVIEISGTPGDRVKTLKVKLGDRVSAGDELAVLESRTLREAELEVAQTQLAEAQQRQTAEEAYADATEAEARLAEEEASLAQLDAKAQQDKIAGLKTAYQASQKDLARLEDVRQSDGPTPGDEIVSDQQLAHQRVATDKARNELAAAEAEYEKLRQSIDLAHRQAKAKLKTAEASRARIPSTVQVDSLRKQVDLAQRRLELTTIRAPSDGVILKLWMSEGETLAQQPILQMADTSRMVAVAEIYEDDALRIKPGESATVKGDALGKSLDGHVTFVGALVAKNTVVGLTPTAATDLRVVEARILLDSSELASKLINLQVTVYLPALAPAESSDQPVESTAQQARNP